MVNETAARQWWPDQDPSERRCCSRRGRPASGHAAAHRCRCRAATRNTATSENSRRTFVYVPGQQQYLSRTTIVARSSQGQRLAGDLPQADRAAEFEPADRQPQTLEDYAPLTLVPQRVAASVSGASGLLVSCSRRSASTASPPTWCPAARERSASASRLARGAATSSAWCFGRG